MMRTLLAFLITVSMCQSVAAEVPQTLNYQGHLSSSGGSPVNAAVDMTFTIYNAATNGTNLWTEDQTVQVNNGIYAVALGAINPIGPAIIDGDLWLGVKVGTDAEMTPRQKLHSVPFALKANALTEGSNLDAICQLFDELKKQRPSFCPPLVAKRVFVTSQTYTGSLGGVAGADNKCQALATAAGLAGTYKAWISTEYGTGPDTNFNHYNMPYVMTNGDWLADNWSDVVDGDLHNYITIDEAGNSVTTYGDYKYAWTLTNSDGSPLGSTAHCNNWTSTPNANGSSGFVKHKGYLGQGTESIGWYGGASNNCTNQGHLYCFEQ